jgi:ubiquinone/menaquinone biosynthesis C-methylase UbiE
MDSAAPVGDGLELACGPGTFRGELARRATFVTAPDASPEMLEIAAARITPRTNVRFAHADLFALGALEQSELRPADIRALSAV